MLYFSTQHNFIVKQARGPSKNKQKKEKSPKKPQKHTNTHTNMIHLSLAYYLFSECCWRRLTAIQHCNTGYFAALRQRLLMFCVTAFSNARH